MLILFMIVGIPLYFSMYKSDTADFASTDYTSEQYDFTDVHYHAISKLINSDSEIDLQDSFDVPTRFKKFIISPTYLVHDLDFYNDSPRPEDYKSFFRKQHQTYDLIDLVNAEFLNLLSKKPNLKGICGINLTWMNYDLQKDKCIQNPNTLGIKIHDLTTPSLLGHKKILDNLNLILSNLKPKSIIIWHIKERFNQDEWFDQGPTNINLIDFDPRLYKLVYDTISNFPNLVFIVAHGFEESNSDSYFFDVENRLGKLKNVFFDMSSSCLPYSASNDEEYRDCKIKFSQKIGVNRLLFGTDHKIHSLEQLEAKYQQLRSNFIKQEIQTIYENNQRIFSN